MELPESQHAGRCIHRTDAGQQNIEGSTAGRNGQPVSLRLRTCHHVGCRAAKPGGDGTADQAPTWMCTLIGSSSPAFFRLLQGSKGMQQHPESSRCLRTFWPMVSRMNYPGPARRRLAPAVAEIAAARMRAWQSCCPLCTRPQGKACPLLALTANRQLTPLWMRCGSCSQGWAAGRIWWQAAHKGGCQPRVSNRNIVC